MEIVPADRIPEHSPTGNSDRDNNSRYWHTWYGWCHHDDLSSLSVEETANLIVDLLTHSLTHDRWTRVSIRTEKIVARTHSLAHPDVDFRETDFSKGRRFEMKGWGSIERDESDVHRRQYLKGTVRTFYGETDTDIRIYRCAADRFVAISRCGTEYTDSTR
jgi:hypothetical protein